MFTARIPQLAVAFAVLLAVAAALYGPHVAGGSFYNDDWGNYLTKVSGPENSLPERVAEYYEATETGGIALRPLALVYFPLTHTVLGDDPGWHNAWAALMAVLMSLALFAVLRELRVRAPYAGAIAVLVLIIPAADATRFQAGSAFASASIAIWLTGLVLSLRALGATGGRFARLRIGALVLYLTSLALYEVTVLAIAAAILLYLTRAPWRRALAQWAPEAALAVVAAAWYRSYQIYEPLSPGAQLDRIPEFAGQAARVFADSAVPFAHAGTKTVAALAGAMTIGAIALLLRREASAQARAGGRVWGTIAALGAGLMVAGWAIFVPSQEFMPLAEGHLNRVNVLAAAGIVLFLFAMSVLVGTAAGERVRRPELGAATAAVLATGVLGAGYAAELVDDRARWGRAASEQRRVLDAVHAEVPDSGGSVVFTFGHPITVSPGIPVLAAPWDIDGALKWSYGDPSITGHVALPDTALECAAGELVMHNGNDRYGPQAGAYGAVWLVDAGARRGERIDSRAQCLAAVANYAPGPQELPPS